MSDQFHGLRTAAPGSPSARRAARTPLPGGGGPVLGPVDTDVDALGPTAPGLLVLSSFLMARTGRSARRLLAGRAACHGFKLWHVMVLCALQDVPSLFKAELAERLELTSSDVARVVDDLVAAGYVTCGRAEEDRRRVMVRLTPSGREAAALVNSDLSAVEDDVLAPLSVADRRRLAHMLTRLFAHLNDGRDTARPTRRPSLPGA
ncbi:MarR family winged helix-turn-helix transcriptional regulator [Kitasatospora sp. NPDC058170]|uniref:MarR family winged helix-turn-helix transcriptional regulator n=1 Tax=Kitasatospora sp. NPDC058170 TaxID=3346364 RepID=UPI0036DDA6B7